MISATSQPGSVVLGATAGCQLLESVYSAGTAMPTHSHDITNLSLILSGTIEEESSQGTITAGPGCVVFKPAGTQHRNRVGSTGAVLFALRLDPHWRKAASRIETYLWCSHDIVHRAMLRLYAFAHATAEVPPAIVEQCVQRWLCLGTKGMNPIPLRPAPPWISRLQSRLHEQVDRSTNIRELAKEFETHPVYVARVFRRYLGSSPTAYARRVRTAQAARQLVATHTPPAAIAAQLGFADQAHFCRCFLAHVGLSPGGYRRISLPV